MKLELNEKKERLKELLDSGANEVGNLREELTRLKKLMVEKEREMNERFKEEKDCIERKWKENI